MQKRCGRSRRRAGFKIGYVKAKGAPIEACYPLRSAAARIDGLVSWVLCGLDELLLNAGCNIITMKRGLMSIVNMYLAYCESMNMCRLLGCLPTHCKIAVAYFILFYFILFYFILFYFILFYLFYLFYFFIQ
jgi:hypothetical protein